MSPQSKTAAMIADAFRTAIVDLKIAPSEFWAMSLYEMSLLLKRAPNSGLSAEEIEELKSHL